MQEILAKEVFSPQTRKFNRIKIVPLYKDETWSADLIDKSNLSKYNKNYKFILTVIDIFTKYAWAIPLKDKSGTSVTNAFKKIVQSTYGLRPIGRSPYERSSIVRTPERLWVDRGKEFYNKTFLSYLKQNGTKIYSTNSDLKAVFVERFNRTLLHLLSKPMFINGDGNWIDLLKDAMIDYNNRVHSTIRMTPAEASDNPENVKYIQTLTKTKPKFKVGDYVRNADKRNIYSKGYTSNWNRELFKIHEVLKTNPPTYRIEDRFGEVIEGKYYEQELLKSAFNFDTNNDVLNSISLPLRNATKF